MKGKRVFACLLALAMTLSAGMPTPDFSMSGHSLQAERVGIAEGTDETARMEASAVGEAPEAAENSSIDEEPAPAEEPVVSDATAALPEPEATPEPTATQ